MATEYRRKRARKKVILPSGEEIFIPVITEIAFVDPFEQYQETAHQIINDSTSRRTVHVDAVRPTRDVDANGVPLGEAVQDEGSEPLYVERVDVWPVLDPFEHYQETQFLPDNVTGAEDGPPHFRTHAKTHIYRYYQDPALPDDNGVWIDTEFIDEIDVIDPFQQSQQTNWTLDNPFNGQVRGQADPNDPDITEADGGEGTIDAPCRTDPFQNIVNWNESTPTSGQAYLYALTGWNVDFNPIAHAFLSHFPTPGYYPKDFGHILLNFVDSGGTDHGFIWYAYGSYSGVSGPSSVSTTGAIDPGWVGTGGGFDLSIAYTHLGGAPDTAEFSFAGFTFTLNGWLTADASFPDAGSPGTFYAPFLDGQVVSQLSATAVDSGAPPIGNGIVGGTIIMQPHLSGPTA